MNEKATALRLADHNADLIQRLRRTPMPLADLIPHLQAMGDELRRLHEENEKFKAANITLMERIDRRDSRIAALEQAGRMTVAVMGRVGADLVCETSHHKKADRHGIGEPCPLQLRWHQAFAALRQALGEDA